MKDPLESKTSGDWRHYNNTTIKHTSQYDYNNSTGSSIPKPLVSEAIEMKIKLIVIKQEVSNGNT